MPERGITVLFNSKFLEDIKRIIMPLDYSYNSSSQILHVTLNDVIYVQDVLDHFERVISDNAIEDVAIDIVSFENVNDFAFAQDEAASFRDEFVKFKLEKKLLASVIIANTPFQQGMAKMLESIIGHNIDMHIVDSKEMAMELAQNLLDKRSVA